MKQKKTFFKRPSSVAQLLLRFIIFTFQDARNAKPREQHNDEGRGGEKTYKTRMQFLSSLVFGKSAEKAEKLRNRITCEVVAREKRAEIC